MSDNNIMTVVIIWLVIFLLLPITYLLFQYNPQNEIKKSELPKSTNEMRMYIQLNIDTDISESALDRKIRCFGNMLANDYSEKKAFRETIDDMRNKRTIHGDTLIYFILCLLFCNVFYVWFIIEDLDFNWIYNKFFTVEFIVIKVMMICMLIITAMVYIHRNECGYNALLGAYVVHEIFCLGFGISLFGDGLHFG